MANDWLEAADQEDWIRAFDLWGEKAAMESLMEQSKKGPADISTPKKKAAPKKQAATPKEKSRAPKKVGECRAATFSQPKKTPEVLARAKQPVDLHDSSVQEADENLEILRNVPLAPRIRRCPHKRIAKRLAPSRTVLEHRAICQYLGKIGMIYQRWSSIHYRPGMARGRSAKTCHFVVDCCIIAVTYLAVLL